MRIYLAVTPEETRQAARFHRTPAHAAYRIGPEGTLLRRNLPLQTQGGLLCVSDNNAPPLRDAEPLSQAVLRECGRRSYQGVLLDLSSPPRQDLKAFGAALATALASAGKSLYLPDDCHTAGSAAIPLIGTALSGGNFTEHLQTAAARFGGPGRAALDVERVRMDFSLPAPSGLGKSLSARELQDLMERERPAVFFSPDLCARYFTYTREGTLHFVLFDDADTLRRKLKLGQQMGFSAAFFLWPEIADLADRLFAH